MRHCDKVSLPHAVYRFFNELGQLLYVGCSTNPFGGRLGHHGTVQPWAREIAFVKVKWYPDWGSGRRAEAEAILTENPAYNQEKTSPERVGQDVLRRAARLPRGDGITCPRCGNPKEDLRPGKAYCRSCYAEYRKERRLKQIVKV